MRPIATTLFLALAATLSLTTACGPENGAVGDGDGDGDGDIGICGDGSVDSGEQCDDGNTSDADGCDASCNTETVDTCGNGVVDPNEDCDDGNDQDGDGCDSSCAMEDGDCGNGQLNNGEECDDGNTTRGDGCSAQCTIEDAVCGNGRIELGEECDDGNTDPGDGCDVDCTIEVAASCGDGNLDPGEECDDGNNTPGDGCSATCTMEAAVCAPAFSLSCAGSDTWDTTLIGSTDQIDSYSCSPWQESGREYTYSFVAPTASDVTFSLSGMLSDLDVFVLSSDAGCDSSGCLTHGDTSATLTTVAGATYYVVVDGYQGAEGPFSIGVTCGACGDGNVDPGEACDDGNIADGDGCSATCEIENTVCEPAFTLGCGDTDSWNTTFTGSTDGADSYSCSTFDASGREYTYSFTSDVTGQVSVALSNLAVDLDIYVVGDQGGGCDPGNCLGFGEDNITFDAVAGETYFIVVDGYQGAEGSYSIALDCPEPYCASPLVAGCDMFDEWSTENAGATDVIDSYSCSIFDESGPEYAYQFVTDSAVDVTVELIPEAGVDLDLFRLSGGGTATCSSDTCDEYGDNTFTFTAVPNEAVSILVNGYAGASGDYRINFTCN